MVNLVGTFAVLYSPGTRWKTERRFHEQDGVDAGGLAVFRANSIEEVHELVATGESVNGDLLRYEIHPYVIAFQGRETP